MIKNRKIIIIAIFVLAIFFIGVLSYCCLYFWIKNINTIVKHNTFSLIVSFIVSFALITIPTAMHCDKKKSKKDNKDTDKFDIGYITKKTSTLSNFFNIFDLILLTSLVSLYILTTFAWTKLNLFSIITGNVLFISNFSIQTYLDEVVKSFSSRQTFFIISFMVVVICGSLLLLWLVALKMLWWWIGLLIILALLGFFIVSYIVCKKSTYFDKIA